MKESTKIIIALLIILFGVYLVERFRPIEVHEKSVVDTSVRDSTDLLIHNYIMPIIDSLRNSRIERKKIRNEVKAKVDAFTPSDITRFNDSISAVYGLK